MNDELFKEGVERLVQEIRAAAILREAGRMAPDSPTRNAPLQPTQIMKAVMEYKQVLAEMKRQGL